jgi:molybdopterin converting factor small subunit
LAIDVELFGQFAEGRPKQTSLNLGRPVTVRDVAVLLRLEPEAVGLISINGVQSELQDPVPADCRLCFFPPMTGG